jgi:short-subunit dehydrogenase
MKKTVIIVGSGTGLGNAIARKFGKNDFRVVLIARNEASLKKYENELGAEGIEVYSETADAEKPETLTAAFNTIKGRFGTPDVLVYNVGITGADTPGTITAEKLMQHYQVDVASAYHSIQQVLSTEFEAKGGTILITGGGLALYPSAQYIPLSIDKAALRAMAILLNQELAAKGVFLGTVTVAGAITPGTDFAPELIADKYWELYTERKNCEILYQGRG